MQPKGVLHGAEQKVWRRNVNCTLILGKLYRDTTGVIVVIIQIFSDQSIYQNCQSINVSIYLSIHPFQLIYLFIHPSELFENIKTPYPPQNHIVEMTLFFHLKNIDGNDHGNLRGSPPNATPPKK